MPLSLFKLFMTEEVLDTVAANTNAYAAQEGPAERASGGRARPWKTVTTAELKIWLGLVVYMSVVRATLADYWTRSVELPTHAIAVFMSRTRFEQIKRYLHLSPPGPVSQDRWWTKVEPMASQLKASFRRYLKPRTMVSIDEIIVRFTARSVHTTMMRGKPVPEGYKVFARCDAGYVFAFIFDSPVAVRHSIGSIGRQSIQRHYGSSPGSPRLFGSRYSCQKKCSSSCLCLYGQLLQQRPALSLMRGFGLGACGAARRNSLGWPEEFKRAIKDRRTDRFPPDAISSVVKDRVLAFVWQDTNLVHFLTTARDGSTTTTIKRKRPSAGNANRWYRDFVATIWGNRPVVERSVPTFAVEYNYFMGGVDVHDQLRSYNPTQLTVRRNWMPLCFWMLDSCIINAHLISRERLQQTAVKKVDVQRSQRLFSVRLAWNLVLEGSQELFGESNRIFDNVRAKVLQVRTSLDGLD